MGTFARSARSSKTFPAMLHVAKCCMFSMALPQHLHVWSPSLRFFVYRALWSTFLKWLIQSFGVSKLLLYLLPISWGSSPMRSFQASRQLGSTVFIFAISRVRFLVVTPSSG